MLNVDDLFYAPHGYCMKCRKRLTGHQKRWCDKCNDTYPKYSWDEVRKDLLKKNDLCCRCRNPRGLEIDHVVKVADLKKKYNPLTREIFCISIHSSLDEDFWIQYRKGLGFDPIKYTRSIEGSYAWILVVKDIEIEWRKQLERNRKYMRAVLDKKALRVICHGCHKYFHTRENIVEDIEGSKYVIKKYPDWSHNESKVKLEMAEFRLIVLDQLNDPKSILFHGYTPYWDNSKTRYSAWYERIKTARVIDNPEKYREKDEGQKSLNGF